MLLRKCDVNIHSGLHRCYILKPNSELCVKICTLHVDDAAKCVSIALTHSITSGNRGEGETSVINLVNSQ